MICPSSMAGCRDSLKSSAKDTDPGTVPGITRFDYGFTTRSSLLFTKK
jgi:hypothetical protein